MFVQQFLAHQDGGEQTYLGALLFLAIDPQKRLRDEARINPRTPVAQCDVVDDVSAL
jgi:hypothetical protein